MLRPVTIALLLLGACSSSSSTTSDRPAQTSRSASVDAEPDLTPDPAESNSETPADPPARDEAWSPTPEALASLPHDGPGPAVGKRALPFTLPDQRGDARSLDEFLGQGPVAVVFLRSADW